MKLGTLQVEMRFLSKTTAEINFNSVQFKWNGSVLPQLGQIQ